MNNWSVNDVSNWLIKELISSGFDDSVIDSFMIKWSNINVNGELLQTWIMESNNNHDILLKQLQEKINFSSKSVVWDVVIGAIYGPKPQ